MESDDSGPYHRRKRKSAVESSSDESDFDVVPSTSNRRRKNLNIIESNSDTDSDSSIEVLRKKRSRPSAINDSDSSGSEIVTRKHGATRIPSDSEESCESDWSVSSLKSFTLSKKVPVIEDNSSSDSDGQSDKCPICLISFKSQEVGSPESCDHSFCIECIQEWSKNVNTCPVDRQPFSLILVRNHYNGRVIRQVQVEPATQQINLNEVVEDPTYCEICGSCDREDRMLLCDGCDLGYHLECLTPPLSDVPTGVWYCGDCGPDEINQDVTVYLQEVELLYNDVIDMPRPTGPRRRTTTRLVPRTRQTERVRARIITNRTQNRNQRNEIEQQIEVVVRQDAGPSRSRRKTKKKPKKGRRKPQIKITYEIDESTGQQIVIETKTHKYTKKRKKKSKARSARIAAKPKTVKKRLAVQLGMCAPRTSGQTLPDVRISSDNSSIGFQRSQAGIPRLHLFGRSGELDYFSDSDMENDEGGVGLLRRRRPNMSDAAIFRRNASRKNILLQSSNTCDLLDSILDSQEKFHSKNAVLSLKKDGTIKIDTNNKPKNNNRNDRINLNDANAVSVRQTPMCSNTTSSTNGSVSINNGTEYRNSINAVSSATTTISNNSVSTSSIASDPGESSQNSNYSLQPSCSGDLSDIKKSEGGTSPHSESELDIYSDIETVSTSKAEDEENKTPTPIPEAPLSMQSDDEANNSDIDLVIDTEKVEEKIAVPDEETESKEEAVSSTTNVSPECEERAQKSCDEEDNDSEDGCPNFSIYSAESINLAKTTDLELLHQEANVGSSSADVAEVNPVEQEPPILEKFKKLDGLYSDSDEEIVRSSSVIPQQNNIKEKPEKQKKSVDVSGLYSDSDDEIVKVDTQKPFGIGDIRSMTEDISEEERSYTPCLDERAPFGEGLDGLDTEAISDEEKNDFDESHELKTASDGGDALEINAKECELDFTKPEEYEEGEIVDKLRKLEEAKKAENTDAKETTVEEKETESTNKDVAAFKKISKSNKDRNYRDKEKQSSRSPSKDKENDKKRDRKKEKRKEIERYNVRTVLAEKPRRMKDKFGRDRRRSGSRSSRSTSPPYRSPSRGRRSYSREKSRKRRARTHSRSRSRKRSRSRHRRRSASRPRVKRRRTRERSKNRKKNRSLSRQRSRSNSPRRRRDWERRSRGWSPSPTRSRSPLTPSWTPPRVLEKQPVKPHNLTVILTNDSNKKKKDKKKTDKKRKENAEKQKKRKRDKTPPPSKEVFASGDNILVSVSFNDEREREATVKRKRDDEVTTKRTRKEKARKDRSPRQRKRKAHDLSGIKPVAIIDLDRSPFKELTPSPKDVIVLSDSENGETREDNACVTNQQPDTYPTGPKTPPEPQVKFSLNAKPAQLRAISNPLHEPDDMDGEMDPQEELEQRLNESLHKGPNTPPEPPNSPPSSPDAYDPFDPTKSRSPTPEISTVQSTTAQSTDNNRDESSETMDKSALPRAQTPDISHTPPVVPDVQPADSQSNTSINTPDTNSKQTPERSIGVVINQVVQSQASSIFPAHSKSIVQTSYSSASLVTSTPISSNLAVPRINILNSTILAPATVMSSVPQRIVLPTTTKSSPIKVSPTKPPIKSTPIKPMPNKNISKAKVPMRKSNSRSNNDTNDSPMALDSPYSPGPSDYEDLFEPPSEPTKLSKSKSQSNNKSGNKPQGSFDALFGSSPIQKFKTANKSMDNKKKKGTKLVGVKVDEDSLKILDDVPNSAVEMQVKDKFLKKLNRQERVVEEVKLVLKPHYNKKHINKDEYKDILRRAVPKICHNKSGEINPKKIQNLIEAYVKKIRHSKKVTSSSSVNPQK